MISDTCDNVCVLMNQRIEVDAMKEENPDSSNESLSISLLASSSVFMN